MHGILKFLFIALLIVFGFGSFFVWCSKTAGNDSRVKSFADNGSNTAVLALLANAKEVKVTGTIVDIAKELRSITIVTEQGRRLTLQADALATLRFKGARIEIVELQVGNRITTTFLEGDRKVMRSTLIERED